MSKRRILYGYQIRQGEIILHPQEADVAKRIASLYLDGLSYQKISDILNQDGFPFSTDTPLWNKHKVKRLLENPRYTGADGYPVIVDQDTFNIIQDIIQEKTSCYTKAEKRPVQQFKKYLRCGSCHGRLLGMGGRGQQRDTLYLRCEQCGSLVTRSDMELMNEVSRQMAEHDRSAEQPYAPSSEVIRLTNAINRGLEHPDKPEDTVSLILQGASARYGCCPTSTESEPFSRPAEVNFKHFGQAVSHITITDGTITVHFK